MKEALKPGLGLTRRIVVDRPRTIDFLGAALRVYSTPALVRDFELACRELLCDHCDADEDSVGTGIAITHSGATLIGMPVEIAVTVKGIDGRRVQFDLLARDALEEIARGEHGRFIVEIEKLRARLAQKARKSGGG